MVPELRELTQLQSIFHLPANNQFLNEWQRQFKNAVALFGNRQMKIEAGLV